MKLEKFTTLLTATILAALISAGAAGCLVTAFNLDAGSMTTVFLTCGLCALLDSILFQWKYGGTAALVLLAAGAGYLWHRGDAWMPVLRMLEDISVFYDRAYDWGRLNFDIQSTETLTAALPIRCYGGLCALTVSRTVCRQKSLGAVIVTLLPLWSCVVVTDTVPDPVYLFILLAGLALLILTQSVRREDLPQSNRLAALLALPVALALTAVFLPIPQEGYVNPVDGLRSRILNAAAQFPGQVSEQLQTHVPEFTPQVRERVALSTLGPRFLGTDPVLEITDPQGGTVYLREKDYCFYTGQSWTTSEDREEHYPVPAGDTRNVRIRTRNGMKVQFLPGYPTPELTLTDGSLPNPQRQRDYTFVCASLPEDWRIIAYTSDIRADIPSLDRYLELPVQTRAHGKQLLEGLFSPEAGNTEKAERIAALVSSTAVYDMDCPITPVGTEDFAIWFLREGERGYCVHFATAATVLLRCAGVPARYVAGYMADTVPGQAVTVTEDQAHAWAEYYEPALGCWIPLEATPSSADPVPMETTAQTLPPETSVPEQEAPAPSVTDRIPEQIQAFPVQEAPAGESFPFWTLALPVLLMLTVVQRQLRLALRRRWYRRGDPNAQALHRWRDTEIHARVLKEAPPETLLTLAQKAKFSRHTLNTEELAEFDRYIRSCQQRLREKPWYLRWFYRFIYPVY